VLAATAGGREEQPSVPPFSPVHITLISPHRGEEQHSHRGSASAPLPPPPPLSDPRGGLNADLLNPRGKMDAGQREARGGLNVGLLDERVKCAARGVLDTGWLHSHLNVGLLDAGQLDVAGGNGCAARDGSGLDARDGRATWWDRLEQLEPQKVHEGDITQDWTGKGREGCLNSSLDDVNFVPETELQDLLTMEAKDKVVGEREFAGVDIDAETDDESIQMESKNTSDKDELITEEQKVRWLN
jgi:hypothetical protein